MLRDVMVIMSRLRYILHDTHQKSKSKNNFSKIFKDWSTDNFHL